jgi:hypothetical protein
MHLGQGRRKQLRAAKLCALQGATHSTKLRPRGNGAQYQELKCLPASQKSRCFKGEFVSLKPKGR